MQSRERLNWRVSSSPHIRSPRSTRTIMLDVIIALIPTGIAGVIRFGASAAILIALSVISAVIWEAIAQRAMKKPITVTDLSAVITGLLIAYNLPSGAPYWLAVVGSGIAIILIKQIFGGLGQNFLNPALGARAIMLASWTGLMSGSAFTAGNFGVDAAATATPLITDNPATFSLWSMFIGDIPGCIGEVSKLAVLVGGIYLILRGVISWRVPVTMLLTVFVAFWISSGTIVGRVDSPVYQLLSGGLMLGAFFMATDYATTPVTPVGKLVMGFVCGMLVFLIRIMNDDYPESVSYAILIMNLATPLIDRFTKPIVYGKVRVKQNA